jgi:hypothetical protein
MKQNIGILNISVDNFQISHCLHCLEHLSEYQLNLLLSQSTSLLQLGLEISAVAKIDNEIEMILSFYCFV